MGESGSQQPGGPVTLSYSPEGNVIGVPLSARVVVTASAPLDPLSVNASTLYLVGPGGQVPSAVTYSNNTATLTPSAPLQAGAPHTAVATIGIRSASGAAVLAANHSWTFTTAAGDLPPLFARWESDMTTYGAQWGEFQNPNGPNAWAVRFDRAYYDVLHIMYQIKSYTGQSLPWDTYIGYAKSSYRDEYYRPNDYRVPGYRRFAHGLLADYLAGGDTTIDDIRKIRDNPAFSNLSEYNGAYAGPHQVMSRELAYALEAHIAAEKAGESRQAQVSQFVTWMENHLHEWKSGQFAGEAWFQPFMFGLTAQALIEFYEWEVANNRDPNAYWPKTHWPTIPAAIADFSDWMYTTAVVRDGPDAGQRMWAANFENSGYGGFRYMDRNNTSISAEGSSVTPDLNALIAPVYAWVYKQTGSKAHRAMGDEVFAGGVHFSAASWGGKMFNQSYRWSIRFVQWRREGDQLWP